MNRDINNSDLSDDEMLHEIKKSIAAQISDVLDENTGDLDAGNLNAVESVYEVEDAKDNDLDSTNKKKKMPRWLKRTSIVCSVLLVLGLIIMVGIHVVYGRLNYDDGSNTYTHAQQFETDDDTQYAEVDPNSINWDDVVGDAKKVNGVFNILLLGVEAIGTSTESGRTDSIMIATVNTQQKTLKLTSIMRDTYVQIPGYNDNRINSAYGTGGIPLLKETIQENFNIELDGYVLVNFEGFEKIIDKLGGVEVSLSEAEAKYLNSTNYISDKSERNVVVGKQTLNGNQARGYCRIRHVATEENGSGDYGRTSRQRTVLNAIFEKYKSKSTPELLGLLWDVLPSVTTDIKQDEIVNYVYTVVSMGTTELQTLRIPVDNGYKGAKIRGMSVLLPDLEVNIEELHNFVFGESANADASDESDDQASSSTQKLTVEN